ncbi:MAG: HlyD family secretion protein [Pirellulaceae bacterium]|jgi:HlyD family secretion protein
MIRRLIPVFVVVALLAGLIIFSQTRSEPNRVSGFIEADEIRLGSRVGGRVAKVHVEEGQEVVAGEMLLELEPFDLLEREKEAERTLAAREATYQRFLKGLRAEEVAQAKARRDQLKAKLDLLEAGPREQEVNAAAARLRSSEAELKLADQLYKRDLELSQSNTITEQELERTRQAYDSAVALLTVRKNELELLRLGTREEEIRAARAALEEADQAWQLAGNGYRQEEIDQAKAARDATQAALDAIRRQKEELIIKSPLAGIVDSLDLQPGDMVPLGAPVVSIVDHRHLWVRAFVPQNRIGLKIGQKLRVGVDSLPDQSFVGKVTYIARQAEFTPSNVQTPTERGKQVYRIKVVLEELNEHMRPGMTADVWLDAVGDGS